MFPANEIFCRTVQFPLNYEGQSPHRKTSQYSVLTPLTSLMSPRRKGSVHAMLFMTWSGPQEATVWYHWRWRDT